MPVSIGNVLFEMSKKFFLNLLDSNTTIIVKDIFFSNRIHTKNLYLVVK